MLGELCWKASKGDRLQVPMIVGGMAGKCSGAGGYGTLRLRRDAGLKVTLLELAIAVVYP